MKPTTKKALGVVAIILAGCYLLKYPANSATFVKWSGSKIADAFDSLAIFVNTLIQ